MACLFTHRVSLGTDVFAAIHFTLDFRLRQFILFDYISMHGAIASVRHIWQHIVLNRVNSYYLLFTVNKVIYLKYLNIRLL